MSAPMPFNELTTDNLIAHRGLQARFPENTRLSLAKAIEVGAKYIELDVQFSADHLPIIYHDANLQRVSDRRELVSSLNRQQLLNCSAHESQRFGDLYIAEKIAPLEALVELLQANPHVTAFVEIKRDSIPYCGRDLMVQSVQSILKPVSNRTVIISDDYKLVQIARVLGCPNVGIVLEQWQDLLHPIVVDCRADFIFAEQPMLPQTLAENTIPQSTQLVVYEVGDLVLGKHLLSLGVDMLETFNLENFLANG